MQGAAVAEGADPLGHPLLVDVHQQVEAALPRHAVAKLDHLPEFPGGIDVQQGKRRLGRKEGLARQVQHHRRILADGVKHHRVLELGHHFPQDVDALGLELFQVGQFGGH